MQSNVVNMPSQNEYPMIDMINEVFRMNKNDALDQDAYEGPFEYLETMPNEEYVELLRDCNQELYEDVKSTQSCFFY